MKKAVYLVLIALVFGSGCSHWRVSSLSEQKMFNIPVGDGPGQVSIRSLPGGIIEQTFNIIISNDQVFCVDNNLGRLSVFDDDGSLELVIGNVVPLREEKNLKKVQFSFSHIGKVVFDGDDRIYVQNRLTSGEAQRRSDGNAGIDIVPSYVLVFDEDGKLLHTLGQGGAGDVPFQFIENMVLDSQKRLHVVSKTMSGWNISRYKGRDRLGSVVVSDKDCEDKTNPAFTANIENIIVSEDGESLLIAVAYYDGTRFKYRKIIEYKLSEGKPGKTVLEIPDPRNELKTTLDDQYIVLWEVDERDLRFVIWNYQGNIVNNVRIDFGSKRGLYKQVEIDESGNFYTFVVTHEKLELARWK